jgi:NAD(P)-dependent dehydrogenase (short-subunit alcohol dehydrogenase family)
MAVVLITGCRSGIGLQTALAFARRGDRVYATSRDVVRADQLRQSVNRECLPVEIQALDVTDGDAVRRMVGDVVAREGRIDVLVNNAGIGGGASAIEEVDEDVARAVWETNFWAPFRLIRAVLPHMRGQGSGVIVNLSTNGARFPGGPGLAMYGMSKQAISRLSESLQAELRGTGVRVVAMEPGFFSTEIYSGDKRPAIDPASPYAPIISAVDTRIAEGIANGADPAVVASAILAAVDDPASPTRVLVGDDAIAAFDAYRRALLATWHAELTADSDAG